MQPQEPWTRRGVAGFARGRLRALAEKVADRLLLLALAAAVGAGGTVLGLLKRALAVSWLLIAVGVTVLVLAGLLGLLVLLMNVRDRLRFLEQAFYQGEYEKRLLYEALESIQEAVGQVEPWDVDDLVERGILGPLRGLLIRAPAHEIRLAVLVPRDDDPGDFRMRWAAGHRPQSVSHYRRPIDTTMAGGAYRSGESAHFADVTKESGFIPNPKATRGFRSQVVVPLRVGSDTVGVLSVVSTFPDVFTPSDVLFLETVGAVLNVVLAFEHDAGRSFQA